LKIHVEGLREATQSLDELEKKVRNKIIRKAQREGCKEIQAEKKRLAPVGETGELKKSIKVRSAKRKKDRISTLVQTRIEDAPHGPLLNYGTKHIEARRFLNQAVDNKGKASLDRLTIKMRNEIVAHRRK